MDSSVLIAWFAVFIDFLSVFIVSPVLTPLALQYDATATQVTLLFSIALGSNIISSFAFGKARDTFKRTKPLILLSFAGSTTCLGLMPMANSYGVLVGIRCCGGFFSGTMVLSQSYIARNSPPENRARYMAVCTAMVPLAVIFGPALGGGLYSVGGLRLPFFVASSLGAIGFTAALALFKDDPPTPTVPAAPKQDDAKVEEKSAPPAARPSEALMREHAPLIRLVTLCGYLHYFAMMTFQSLGLYFMQVEYGTDPVQFSLVQTMGGIAATACQTLGFIKVSPSIGKHTCEVIGIAVTALGYSVMALAGSLQVFLVGVGLIFSGSGFGIPAITTLLARYSTPSRMGAVLGSGQACMGLGRFIGSFAAGPLYTVAPRLPFAVAAAMAAATSALMMLTLHLNRQLPEKTKAVMRETKVTAAELFDETFRGSVVASKASGSHESTMV